MSESENTPKAEVVVNKEEKSKKSSKEKVEKEERIRAPRTGRIIVRNLGFDIGQKHLQSHFQQFGSILEINIPSKSGNEKLNRGFGFIEYNSKDEA